MELYQFDPQKKEKLTTLEKQNLKEESNGSGAKRAALLLIALGKNNASQVVKYLDENILEEISREISQVSHLQVSQREQILNDFFQDFKTGKFDSAPGNNFVKELLLKAFGEQKAAMIILKISEKDTDKYFKQLEKADPSLLAGILSKEHPQITSLILAHLNAKISATILQKLPIEMRTNITRRLAKLGKTSPGALVRIAKLMDAKVKKHLEGNTFENAGGMDKIVKILNQVDLLTEKHILEKLQIETPKIAEKIKMALVTFENLGELSNHELRLIIDRIDSKQTLAFALKGANEELKRHFLSNVSRNKARDIMNESQTLENVTIEKIQSSRDEIMRIARVLDKKGEIILRKDKEKWL